MARLTARDEARVPWRVWAWALVVVGGLQLVLGAALAALVVWALG